MVSHKDLKMKIEHIAIWVKDIDKVCEFYQKYFGGVIHPIYHNPTKQFTSRFVTFDDGARLEIMHRPDINQTDMFHVERLQTSEAATNSFVDISEVQQVGSEGANTRAIEEAQRSEYLGYAHVSFSVGSKEEVDRLTKQMSADGIQVVGQPRTTGDGYYESVILDPEGNRVEITV